MGTPSRHYKQCANFHIQAAKYQKCINLLGAIEVCSSVFIGEDMKVEKVCKLTAFKFG